jgi:hypothetical protein
VTFNLRKGNLSQELERVHKLFAKNVFHHPLGKKSYSSEEKLLKNTQRMTFTGEYQMTIKSNQMYCTQISTVNKSGIWVLSLKNIS